MHEAMLQTQPEPTSTVTTGYALHVSNAGEREPRQHFKRMGLAMFEQLGHHDLRDLASRLMAFFQRRRG